MKNENGNHVNTGQMDVKRLKSIAKRWERKVNSNDSMNQTLVMVRKQLINSLTLVESELQKNNQVGEETENKVSWWSKFIRCK